ncbi:MAG: GNAT family N-acetyltransferase [Halodesulfurarchaeum sp.]
MNDVSVELAAKSDLEAVLDCWVHLLEGQRSCGAHIESEANRPVAGDLLNQYALGGRLAVARDDGGSIVGFVMFYREEGVFEQSVTRGIIENLFVVEPRRGEGVVAALLAYAERRLAERGVDVATLSAMAANDSAQSFYRTKGYKPHRVEFERMLEDPKA